LSYTLYIHLYLSLKKANELISSFSGHKSIEEIFTNHSEWLEGQELPGGIVPNSKGYNVSSVSKESIKLFKAQGKAKIGKIIKWSSIRKSRLPLLVKDRIIESDNFESLEYPEQKSVIGELLINKDFKNSKILILNLNSRKEMGVWTRVVKDLELAFKERDEVLVFRKGVEAHKSGDMILSAPSASGLSFFMASK